MRDVELSADVSKFVLLKAKPDRSVLGKKVGGRMREVEQLVLALSSAQVSEYKAKGELVLSDAAKTKLVKGDLEVHVTFQGDSKKYESATDEEVLVVLDVEPDVELIQAGLARYVLGSGGLG